MNVKVKLHLFDSDDSSGVKLWAIAQDGSSRRWFKRYDDRGMASSDAEHMGLVEETRYSPSESRYVRTVGRKLYDEVEIDDGVLNTHWHDTVTVNMDGDS